MEKTNTKKTGKCYSKSFTYKGQMVNYYNKVRQNKDVEWCTCSLDAKTGYTVTWKYFSK